MPKEKVPLMVRKSDGGFGYGTTDMATLRQRIQVHHAALPVSSPCCSASEAFCKGVQLAWHFRRKLLQAP